MYLVGLTGGIGSGKSTVAERLRELGAHVIDADQVAREIVEPGEPALHEIAERFGAGMLTADGHLDRQALADVVFADEEARVALNGITHPRIGERIQALAADHATAERTEDRPRIVVIDHPLLVETGQAGGFADVVVVVAPEEVRVRRLVDRGVGEDDARARIRAQADDATRLQAATHVIDNEGDLAALRSQVDAVWAELRAAADAAVTGDGDR